MKKIKVPSYHFNLIKSLIESNGGELISKEYINCYTKMEFKDKNGNVFYKCASKIKKT